jgi:hypothetical protein
MSAGAAAPFKTESTMANTTDFLSAVYDQLAKILGITDAGPSLVMQMAWPGFSLSPQDFKRADAPAGPYDPEVARATFSRIANIVPVLNRARFDNSGFEVDDIYEILISSAIPVGATQDTLSGNPLNKLFNDAQFEFLQSRRPAPDDPNDFYHPCTAMPANWYDEATTASWTKFSISPNDIRPAMPDSPFVKMGGATLVQSAAWKVRPLPGNVDPVKDSIQKSLTDKVKQAPVHPGPLVPGLGGPTLPGNVTHVPGGIGGIAHAESFAAGTQLHIMALPKGAALAAAGGPATAAQRDKTIFTRKIAPTMLYAKPDVDQKLKTVDLTQQKLNLQGVSVNRRLALEGLVDEKLPAKPPSTTDRWSVAFEYCRVNLVRPWFKLALLSTPHWYMFATAAGEYSTGAADKNPGMFPLLPVSFIVIRNLQISANWSPEDRETIKGAVSFGFFNLRDARLTEDRLQVNGMQIIGWSSHLMPRLPPAPPSP